MYSFNEILANSPSPGQLVPCSRTGLKKVSDLLCAGAAEQAADLARLASYATDRVGVVRALLQRLATLPEAIEIGRVTGLTLGQVHSLHDCAALAVGACAGNL